MNLVCRLSARACDSSLTRRRWWIAALLLSGCTRIIDLGESAGDDPGGADASTDAVEPADSGSADARIDADAAEEEDAGSSGDASASGDADADAGVPPTGPSYVFVTRAEYNANMGSLAAADLRCESSAHAAGLTGTYRAWLSDANTDAKDRIEGQGPWLERGTDAVMFPTRASLTGFPDGPLARDEYGDEAPDRWWTGTLANGLRDEDTCESWTSTAELRGGMTGSRSGPGRPGKEWTEDSVFSCTDTESQKFALICFGPM